MSEREPDYADDFGNAVHEYYAHYVDNADAKAGAVATANLAVAGLLLANMPAEPAANALAWAATAAATIAVAIAGAAIFPRLPSGSRGLIFWEEVRRHPSAAEYARIVSELTVAEANAAWAENSYYVARVLHRKFALIQRALLATAVAMVAAGISLALA